MLISSQLIFKFAIGVLLIGALMLLLKSNYVKGWFGELIVNLLARISLDKKTYHLVKNVTLPTEDSTTQIDHIIVSKYGLFVVETKNMKGWIFGSKEIEEWTQQIYKHKNKFQNPLRQNYRHTEALEKILGLMPNKIFSVIVFVGDSTFKTEMPDNVTYTRGYIDYIKSKTEPLFGDFEVQDIIKKIEDYRLDPGLKTHKRHIENLKNQHSSKIDRKLRRARRKKTSLPYRLAIVGVMVLVFGGVARKTIFKKPEAVDQQVNGDGMTTPHIQPEQSPAQKELNKVYQYRDAQGKVSYTNVPTSPNAKLVEGNTRFTAKPLAIELDGDKVLIPVTIRNKGVQMETKLLLDETIPITILPLATANFFEAASLGTVTVTIAKGETVTGEKRRVSYFAVGDTVEQNIIFLAVDKTRFANTGILGKDFATKHPFSIDKEKNLLVWQ